MEISSELRQHAAALNPTITLNSHACRFRFGDLPREIRDIVYHELWKATPGVRVPYEQNHLHLSYGDYGWWEKHDGLPAWLFANKAIMKEGIQQLLLKASWSWTQPRIEDEKKESYKISPILVPIQAEELRMNFMTVTENGYEGYILQLREATDDPDDMWLLADIYRKSHNAKKLHLYISLAPSPYSAFDFSHLTPFEGLLQELVVDVSPYKCPADEDPNLRLGLDAEIACLGRFMVGGNDSSFDVVSSTFEDEADAYWGYNYWKDKKSRVIVPRKAYRYTFIRKEQQAPAGDNMSS